MIGNNQKVSKNTISKSANQKLNETYPKNKNPSQTTKFSKMSLTTKKVWDIDPREVDMVYTIQATQNPNLPQGTL